MKFETKAIHAGQEPDPSTGAIMTPIFQTSTYVQTSPGVNQGYEYARTANPTRSALEACLASLENAKYAYAFGSGMAAIHAITTLLNPNDKVIATADIYGGSYRLFTKVTARYGVKFDFVDVTVLDNITNALTPNTKMVWIESPTNPSLRLADIKAIKAILPKGVILVVDNTFASPYLQNPLDLGADIVMHSATKYLGGHSDVISGCVMLNDDKIAEDIKFIQKSVGAVPAPMDAFLLLRGIKTLHLRMERHCQNAQKVAEFLYTHPKVEAVHYPGLPSHPQHNLAKQQMRGFGGMLSFTLMGNKYEDAIKFLESTKLFALAESLGGVESLISHPASMTHAAIPKADREKAGIPDTLIRISVGVESIDDLLAELISVLEGI